MADAYTPNLALVKPEVGASRDSWGAKTNANWDVVDEFVQMAMPTGAILDYAGPTPPPGWLACDGRAISRTTYSELFAALGTAWGAGDGATTFNLPPANGRAAVGAGTVTDANGITRNYTYGSRAGVLTYTIKQVNIPAYNLTASVGGAHSHSGVTTVDGAHQHWTDEQGSHQHNTGGTGFGTNVLGDHAHSGGTDSQGSHDHTVSLWAMGTGAASGGVAVMSSALGGASYPTSINGAHVHAINTNTTGAHAHNLFWDGLHTHITNTIAGHTHGIAWDDGHTHTVASGGSGTPFDIVQPVMVVSKIIYAGSQAAVTATTAAVPLVRRLMSAPMRGSH